MEVIMGIYKNEYEIIENVFTPIYLTVIALIQGIALSLLIQKIVLNLETDEIFYWKRYVVGGVIIFSVWHHYMYTVIYLRWFPDVLESLLPLSIGVSEIFMAELSNNAPEQWLLSVMSVFFFGGFAYFNAAFKIRPLFFEERINSSSDAEKHCKNISICHGVAGIFCILHAFFLLSFALCFSSSNLYTCFMYLVLFYCIIHVVVYELYYSLIIRPHFREAIKYRKSE